MSALEELRGFFGVGRIYVGKRHDNHRESLGQYMVMRRRDLLETVIPFFQEHPLRTAKQRDFEKFAAVMEIVAEERHFEAEGLIEIAKIAKTMNRNTPRAKLIRILRGHTPEVQDTGS